MIETKRWSPAWLKKEKGKKLPVFLFRPGPVLERDEFEAELEGRNAAGVPLFMVREIAREGIKALADNPDDAEAMIELIDRDYAVTIEQDGAEPLSLQEKGRLKTVTDILKQHWPDYRAAMEQNARYTNLLPTLALMRWCAGWENLTDDDGEPIEYARNARGEIPDDIMRRIPAILIRTAGFQARELQYGRGQAKN